MALLTRRLSALAAAALLAPLLPLAAASPALAAGEDTPPPPRSVADFCANVPEDFEPFTDIDNNTFEANIKCLAASEITLGGPGNLPEDQYGPGLPVRRDGMASFIARLIDKADELDTGDNAATLPPFDGDVDFNDVSESSVHAANIDRLAEAGVVAGGPGGRPTTEYGPSLEVTRAQMASFIRNALRFITGEEIASSKDFFTDDETAVPHEPRINAVAELGIAVGNGQDLYNPVRSVSRDQMSGFLTRTLAVLEAADAITPLPFGDQVQTGATEAPDLVAADFMRGTATDSVTIEFTFDEEVTAEDVDEGSFLVYAFDGEQFTAESAQRDGTERSTVRATFDLDAEQAADLTLATVDAEAVEDSDGNTNPIGDAPLGSGVNTTGGRTNAPDVLSFGNFRASQSTTAVDFTFDEDTFVVDDGAGQFQLVKTDGTSVDGTPAENDDGFTGDGSETITIEFEGRVSATETVRGVVLQGTVSDEEQESGPLPIPVPGLPIVGDSPEGTLNPLQVTDMASGGTTTVPDLVTVEVDQENNEVTYTFDENVALEDAELFNVYDRDGEEFPGTEGASSDRDGDRTVIITFAAEELDAVVGGSVDEGAVTQSASGARENQEDEIGVAAGSFEAGETTGPDLVSVTRESATDGVTLRFTFDDEATEPDAGSFFVVSDQGEETALSDCEQGEGTGGESVVECFASSEDDSTTVTVDESEAFTAAQEAVLATVDDGAVTDEESGLNPEGAEPLEDA